MKAIAGPAAVSVAFAGCSDGVSRLPTSTVVAALRAAGFQKITGYERKTFTIVGANVCPSASLAHGTSSLGHGFDLRPRGDYRLRCNVILAGDRRATEAVRARFEDAVATLRSRC